MKNKKQFIKVDLNKQNLNEYITEKRDKIKTPINNFIKKWKQIETKKFIKKTKKTKKQYLKILESF